MSKDILPCPFCGKQPSTGIEGGSDERKGYNFEAYVKCCSIMYVESLSDKQGWCKESKEGAMKRAITKWNHRA